MDATIEAIETPLELHFISKFGNCVNLHAAFLLEISKCHAPLEEGNIPSSKDAPTHTLYCVTDSRKIHYERKHGHVK